MDTRALDHKLMAGAFNQRKKHAPEPGQHMLPNLQSLQAGSDTGVRTVAKDLVGIKLWGHGWFYSCTPDIRKKRVAYLEGFGNLSGKSLWQRVQEAPPEGEIESVHPNARSLSKVSSRANPARSSSIQLDPARSRPKSHTLIT